MKDENDILTKDMVELLKDCKKENKDIPTTAIEIMFQVRSNLERYFQILNKEE